MHCLYEKKVLFLKYIQSCDKTEQYLGTWLYSQLTSYLTNFNFSDHCYFYRNVFSWPNNPVSAPLAL